MVMLRQQPLTSESASVEVMVLCLANFSIAIDVAFLLEDNLAALVMVLEETPSHLVERTLSDGPKHFTFKACLCQERNRN
jgi:hypothetical protein